MPPQPPAPPEQGGSAAEQLAYRLRQQQLTAGFGHYALKTHETLSLLQEATRACALGLQAEFCKYMEYLPDEHQFIVRAGVGWRPGVVGHARVGADLESPTGYAFQCGEPVISNHLASEQRFRTPHLLAEHGIRRAINVLIRGHETRYGVLEVDSPEEGRFTEEDLAFLQGFASLLGVAIERQHAEAALREHRRLLERALGDQEVLTQEMNHRVKNSLSLVAGLLNMQERLSDDANVRCALGDAKARVHAIAKVHDRLWRHDEARSVDLANFLAELCDQMRDAGPGHELRWDIAAVSMSSQKAVPLALLINELVTNAFKHAYPCGAGEVVVSVQPAADGALRLEVSDRGVGIAAQANAGQAQSLGMKLIASLARQLGGEGRWVDAAPGLRFVLDFPRA